MKISNAQNFHSFLKLNSNIIELDLSMSYLLSDSDGALSDLANVFRRNSIQKFVFRGSGAFVYGSRVNTILEALSNTNSIKILDISGQGIGDYGFSFFSKLLSSGLTEIYFEGSNLSDIDLFLSTCKLILESSVTQSSWPKTDYQILLSKGIGNSKSEFSSQAEKLKNQFLQKYRTDIIRVTKGKIASQYSSFAIPEKTEFDILSFREPGIDTLLRECLNINGDEPLAEPLSDVLDKLNKETSIDYFLQNL